MAVDILIVAAFPPELAALRGKLGDELRETINGFAVRADAVGVGIPAAAAGTALRLERHKPRVVVLIGTCGVYPSAHRRSAPNAPQSLAMEQVVVGRCVHLIEPSAIDGLVAFPQGMSVTRDAHGAISAALAATGAPRADVATTLGITTDDPLAARIARAARCDVEHLEAYGVASACADVEVPFATALGIANIVGSSGREQWRTHNRAAGDRAAEVVLRWLELGGAGMDGVA